MQSGLSRAGSSEEHLAIFYQLFVPPRYTYDKKDVANAEKETRGENDGSEAAYKIANLDLLNICTNTRVALLMTGSSPHHCELPSCSGR